VRNIWLATLVCVLGTAAAVAQDQAPAGAAAKGQILVASNGARLGAVYRVGADGSAQMIIDGRMVTVPASTLSTVDGKLMTSLSKSEVLGLH
jgi:hypothetical protein